MAPVVIFPDVVDLAVDYVKAGLVARGVAAPVGARTPSSGIPAAGFVLLRRLGGPRRDIVTDQPQLGVECWADTEHRAQTLAQLVRALLFALRGGTLGGHPVYRVQEFAGPAALPDPDTSKPRYVFTHLVDIRGTEEP
jgi:hypothetical protein